MSYVRSSKLAEIPVAPLRKHIQRWIDSCGYDVNQEAQYGTEGSFSPTRKFCEVIWPNLTYDASHRGFTRLMKEAEVIGFDIADRIVCHVLEEPWLWISDPELAEAYEGIDFRTLDARNPTCESVAQEVTEAVRSAYAECKSMEGVSTRTGIALGRVRAILNAPELACA